MSHQPWWWRSKCRPFGVMIPNSPWSGVKETEEAPFELRRRAVAACGDRLAEPAAVLGELEDRRIAGGNLGERARGCRGGGDRECAAQEVAPPGLHGGDLIRVEEILRRVDELHARNSISHRLY